MGCTLYISSLRHATQSQGKSLSLRNLQPIFDC